MSTKFQKARRKSAPGEDHMTSARRMPAWARPSEILDLTRLAVPVAMSRASFMLMGLTDAIILAWYAPGELPLC